MNYSDFISSINGKKSIQYVALMTTATITEAIKKMKNSTKKWALNFKISMMWKKPKLAIFKHQRKKLLTLNLKLNLIENDYTPLNC